MLEATIFILMKERVERLAKAPHIPKWMAGQSELQLELMGSMETEEGGHLEMVGEGGGLKCAISGSIGGLFR